MAAEYITMKQASRRYGLRPREVLAMVQLGMVDALDDETKWRGPTVVLKDSDIRCALDPSTPIPERASPNYRTRCSLRF